MTNINDMESQKSPSNISSNECNKSPSNMSISSEYTNIFDLDAVNNNQTNDKDNILILDNKIIKYIPNKLIQFTWLELLCIEKTSITNLENIPSNLKTLICRNNNIIKLDGSFLPNTLINLIFINNKCEEIVNLKEGIIEISLEKNNITQLPNIPNSVVILNISDNENLEELSQFGNNLKTLNANDTKITNIDFLNDNIQILETCNCNFSTIKKLPKNLIIWKSCTSTIESIECDFPENLIELNLFNNLLINIPKLPNTLKVINLAENELKHIPLFPLTIQIINLKNNRELNTQEIEQLKTNLSNNVTLLYDNINDQLTPNMFSLFDKDDYFIPNMNNNTQTMSISKYSNNNPHYIILNKIYRI